MKVFNKDKALRQIKLKQNKNTYIKKISIVLSCFILIIGIMYFTFAKFEQNSEEYTLINGKVKYGGSGDIQLSYVVDGVSQSTPPAKGTGYKLKTFNCTNADGEWDSNRWAFTVINFSGKVKCNLEFEEATSVHVTMYGPPGAVITYTDSLGNHTKTLDSTGKIENVEIGIMNNITFEDTTIGKNPDNLSNNYTKTINVNEDTTDIYVMPDNAIYWFGYGSDNVDNIYSMNVGYSTKSNKYYENTNNVTYITETMSGTYSGSYAGIQNINEINETNDITFKAIISYNTGGYMSVTNTKTAKNSSYTVLNTENSMKQITPLNPENNDGYVSIWNKAGGTNIVYAIWYE